MTDDNPWAGKIRAVHEVYCCACVDWAPLPAKTKVGAMEIAREMGWIITAKGWMCPKCHNKKRTV